MKRMLCAVAMMAVGATVFLPTQAIARPGPDIIIVNPPPAPRYERVHAARRGYAWAPGYWNWNGRRHVWARGHWERERPGRHYRQHEWREGANGWQFHRGGWER
jgi:WXXGXW repeat (2 copies)